MVTNKELQLQLNDSNTAKDKLYNDCLKFNRQIEELKRDIVSLENKKNNILEQCNFRADFIKHILMILAGDAEINSKYEVIRDMFGDELKELEEIKNTPKYNQYINKRYPSDRITKDDLI